MKIVLLLLLIWSLSSVTAFGNNDHWNTGYVVMPDGHRLDGELNYNWKAEVLQLKMPNGTLRAYSAGRISAFIFFDHEQNILRKFSTVGFTDPDDAQRFAFMEECTLGTLSVYRRLRHMHEFIKMGRPSMFGSDREMIKDYDNFVYMVLTDNHVVDLEHFNADIWPQMQQEFGKALDEYSKIHQLDPSSTVAKLVLINQYNYLKIKATETEAAHQESSSAKPVEKTSSLNSVQ